MAERNTEWDVFVSHASEDKDSFVRPLATALRDFGVSVWYDEFSLTIGDSISRSIDQGLAKSAHGIVVISRAFLSKRWTEYELRGLVNREITQDKVILPIWHGVTREQVMQFSPSLADKLAIDTRIGSRDVAIQCLRVIRPDLYAEHSHGELKKLAWGGAAQELEQEIERMKEELESVREELAQFQCPHCGSRLAERIGAPVDVEGRDWDTREVYDCGYSCFAGRLESPCPKDPQFPKFEDYELQCQEKEADGSLKWLCFPRAKTAMAHKLDLPVGHGHTREEAERYVRAMYDQRARRWNDKRLG